MPAIRVKRGTRAQIETAKAASGLAAGEPYLITDEDRPAVGTAVNAYIDLAKKSEVDARMPSVEVAALPTPSAATRQMRVLTVNNRCYWSDGTTWIDLTATGGRSAEYASLEAETYALIAARTTHPSNARATIINTLIASLKSSGVWSKLGLLYLLAAADEQAARLNWKTPGTATLTAVNSPTFTADRGFTGDGVAAYLDTGVAINALPNFSQNSGSISGWGLNNESTLTTNTNHLIGSSSNVATQRFLLNSRSTAGKVYGSINGAVMSSTNNAGSGDKFVAVSRLSSTTASLYQSGIKLDELSVVSETLGTASVGLLRNSSGRSPQQIAFAAIGGGLTDGEITALYNSVKTYLQALGAVA